jgi:glutamine synthetase
MIRALFDESPEAARIENRVAEPAANPYFVFAAQIHAGLAGINEGLSAPAPVEASYSADVPRLPTDMGTAIQAFEESDFVKSAFGSDFAQYYTTLKRAEWTRYLAALSDWEAREYFDLF